MPLKYGSTTVTVLKYGGTTVQTGKYGDTVVYTATKKMSDQITGLSTSIYGGTGKRLDFKWKCVSGFTSSYTAKVSGTLYSVAGVSSTINQTYTQTGSTTEITKSFNTSDNKAVRNFVGTIVFSCTGYDSYTYNANIAANLSDYITVTNIFRDPLNTAVIEFNSGINISYTATSYIALYDNTGNPTYYDGVATSHSGTNYEYKEFTTESGYDAAYITGYIYFEATGFNEYECSIDRYF